MAVVNHADRIYIGTGQASAAYVGSTKVWPPPFRPTDLAGCAVWLDASQLGLANGAAVPSWPNRGSGPEPTLLGTPAPTLRLNALNGLPVVRITGTQGKYRFTGTGVDKDYTLAYIGRKWTLALGRVITTNIATSNILYGFWNDRFDCAYVEGWMVPDDIVGATTSWRLYSGDATAAGTARLFSNGVLLRSHPAPPPALGFSGLFNISGRSPDEVEAADCEIAEVVLYNRKLSDAERQQVESYLRVKWGMPVLFKPTDLGTNLLGWFDGADAASVQITGSGVSNWVNKGSGSSMTCTQTDDAARPSYANQTLTFVSPRRLQVTNSPTAYDYIVVGRPLPASAPEHRTLLRGATNASSHQMLLEPGSTKLAVWNGGFCVAGGSIPRVMTSNTTPAPMVATASSQYPDAENYYAWRAFDENADTLWHTADVQPGWVKIDLNIPRYVSRYKRQSRTPTFHAWKDWVLDGSNDDANWTRVDTVNGESNTADREIRTYVCDAPGAYRFYRWYVYTTWGNYVEAAWLPLYSDGNDNALTWDNVWGIGYGRIDTASPVLLSRDGGAMVSTGTIYTALNSPIASLGGLPGGGQPWGDVKEIIFVTYNSEGHRAMLEGYLAHKWGLTALLPANHPYKTTAP